MLPWVIDRLRTRLPEMLRAAGGAELAAAVDQNAIATAIDAVEDEARQSRPSNATTER